MPMYNKYPYTDFHELNLDWFLEEFKKLTEEWTTLAADNAEFKTDLESRMGTLEGTVQEFTTFVTNYFENLDVQEEINNKLDAMVEDGTMAALIEPIFNDFAAEMDHRMDVLEERMDTFASLPDGSTAGDAELLDIRVGANGVTYNSAGDAVRAQYTLNKNRIDTAEADIVDLKAEDASLDGRLDTAESDIDSLESRMDTAEGNISAVQGDITDMNTELQRVASQSRDNKLDISDLKSRMTTAEGNIRTAQGNISDLASELTSAEGDITDLDAAVSSVQSQYTSLANRTGTLETETSRISGRVTIAENDISGLDTRLTAAEGDIDDNSDDITALKTRMGTAETKISTLEGKMETAESDIDSLEGRMETAESDIDSLEGRMDAAENDIDAAEHNIDSLDLLKADKNGYEPDLIAGSSKGLIGTPKQLNTVFNNRNIASGYPYLGKRLAFRKLVGGSLVLNQAYNSPVATSTVDGITVTNNGDGSFTLNGTNTTEGAETKDYTLFYSNLCIYGHKYLWGAIISNMSGINVQITRLGAYKTNSNNGFQIDECSETGIYFAYIIRITAGATFDNVTVRPQGIDISLLFGTIPQTVGANNYNSIADYISSLETANRGAGVSWMYKYFPDLETGTIPGIAFSLESVCCSKHIVSDDTTTHEYDMKHAELRGIYMLNNDGELVLDPEKNDIQIPNGTIMRRRGRIDLGTCTWTKGDAFSTGSLESLIKIPSQNETPTLLCEAQIVPKSANAVSGNVGTYEIYVSPQGRLVWYYPTDGIADGNAFATLMSGKYLEYDLATPTTESGTAFTEDQKCFHIGTEQLTDYYVEQNQRSVPLPVGNVIDYEKDLKYVIDGIPEPPEADGTYSLQLTVASGVNTFSWVSATPVEAQISSTPLDVNRTDLIHDINENVYTEDDLPGDLDPAPHEADER